MNDILDLIDPLGDLQEELRADRENEAQAPIFHVIKGRSGRVAVAVCFRDVGVPLVWEVHMYANPLASRWLTVGAMMVLLQVPAWRKQKPWGAYAVVPYELSGLYRMARSLPFVHLNDVGAEKSVLSWTPESILAVNNELTTCRVVDLERGKV